MLSESETRLGRKKRLEGFSSNSFEFSGCAVSNRGHMCITVRPAHCNTSGADLVGFSTEARAGLRFPVRVLMPGWRTMQIMFAKVPWTGRHRVRDDSGCGGNHSTKFGACIAPIQTRNAHYAQEQQYAPIASEVGERYSSEDRFEAVAAGKLW